MGLAMGTRGRRTCIPHCLVEWEALCPLKHSELIDLGTQRMLACFFPKASAMAVSLRDEEVMA